MKLERIITIVLGLGLVTSLFTGCSDSGRNISGKTTIELVNYKREAVSIFEEFAEEFNKENPDLNLVIDSPNDAVTIIKTRLIRNDNPDIIAIGGDNTFSNLADADVLADISDYEGIKEIKDRYLAIDKELELVPKEGVYAVPYAANASGILYNAEMFKEHGWNVPKTWTELIELCKEIQSEGISPFTFGYKDTWTTLAPWNALAVNLTSPDIFTKVNLGEDTFANHYGEIAEKQKELIQYCKNDPFAYGYNDACTAFARGESAMYAIGSYAIAQILTVNPEMDIQSFVMPATDDESKNILNSGIDLQFSVLEDTENKEACYRVLEFLQRDENVQKYINNQMAVSCKKGNFTLNKTIEGMKPYIDEDKLQDYPDHHYPAELGADALIQTYLIDGNLDKFLKGFDNDWARYNRDIITRLKEYNEKNQ